MSRASSSSTADSSQSSRSWREQVSSLPSSPGVYWFLGKNDDVLYVGKAKNLKRRILQYATLHDDRPQIGKLVHEATNLRWEVLESELQALLVEAELIRKYQPQFNILLKDDKSNLYIAITHDAFPRVLTVRRPELLRLTQRVTSFGPYQSGYKVRQVLEIARHIFRWCDRPGDQRVKPCFYTHIGLCSGACTGTIPQTEYKKMIGHLKDFLNGKSASLIKELKQEIATLVVHQQFEKAAVLRDQIDAIVHVTSKEYRLKPDLTLPILTHNMEEESLVSLRSTLATYLPLPRTAPLTRIEGYDVSNTQGTQAGVSMVVAVGGTMNHNLYRHFGIKSLSTPNDFGMLKEALTRRQNHSEWGIPDVILIDGGKGQLRSVLSVWKWPSIVVAIAKDPDRLIIPMPRTVANGKDESKKMTRAASRVIPEPEMQSRVSGIKQKRPQTPLTPTYKEILLTPNLPASRLLQTIRDEAHRFSRRLHFMKREKALFS